MVKCCTLSYFPGIFCAILTNAVHYLTELIAQKVLKQLHAPGTGKLDQTSAFSALLSINDQPTVKAD